ncbi:MAG TPA: DMP19 family protein [Tepidisphaeraceae bacterium]|mgnify:CR=1 FL=1|nr:DMP19 family protein [Tepidisphaeraceae bacterium]
MPLKTIHLKVDETIIAAGDVEQIMEPFWLAAEVSGSLLEYEESLRPFSTSQRLLCAFQWYVSEVLNGGHVQFFSNSTGMLWQHPLKACEAMEMPERGALLQAAVDRLGGDPPTETEARNDLMESLDAVFGDLDDRFYDLAKGEAELTTSVLKFIRSRPTDFHFAGVVQVRESA